MIQAKEYPEKKISDAGIPVFDEEFLPIKEGGISYLKGKFTRIYDETPGDKRLQPMPSAHR